MKKNPAREQQLQSMPKISSLRARPKMLDLPNSAHNHLSQFPGINLFIHLSLSHWSVSLGELWLTVSEAG